MIDAVNLTKKFGNVTAVDSLTFHVDEGRVFGFLGPNGAGKTTTIRMLSCLISKTGGEARVAGYEVGNKDDALKIRKLIGLIPDSIGLYDELSVWQNLDFYAKLYELTEQQRKEGIERFLKMLELWDRKDAPVGKLSKGMKQKVAIARALVHEPLVLFLDEPTANLDPEAAKTVRDFIIGLKSRGRERKKKTTIILNTHNLDEAQKICDEIGILATRLLTVGTPRQLRESLWGSKTLVQLQEQVSDSILAAVKRLDPRRSVVVDGSNRSRLVVDVDSPESENPAIVEAIVTAGGHVQFVTELNPSLEDVYLKIVKKEKRSRGAE